MFINLVLKLNVKIKILNYILTNLNKFKLIIKVIILMPIWLFYFDIFFGWLNIYVISFLFL